jgi:hypothetical protein
MAVEIEKNIRSMLADDSTLISHIPSARMSYAFRLQDGALPALTYEIPSLSDESIAGALTVRRATVEITVIAATTLAAVELMPILRGACVAGTYDSTKFEAVIWQGYTVQGSGVGEGDEQEPAEATATIEIYYRE